MKKILGIIPARYQSTRFPGKPLCKILDKPMIIWVAEAASRALGKENIAVATDDTRISEVVTAHGFKAIMTHSNHATGTDRIAEAAMKVPSDIYINIQGDEPLLDPEDIRKIAEKKIQFPNHVINGYTEIQASEDPNSVNIPKVIFNNQEELIYISRSLIPGAKKPSPSTTYYKQVCIYAFNHQELQTIVEHPTKTRLEWEEDIEILRFLELGHKIKLVKTSAGSLAVDVPEDVKKVEDEITNRAV